ncbi:MAG TPA: hypothetical protein PK400_12080 [Phycisphaerales bacterium]|nr:hypothetical protein [Phycisphaerales bacterium]HRQ76745.1 hypothetical protein [Phycisphaerales bacterium]
MTIVRKTFLVAIATAVALGCFGCGAAEIAAENSRLRARLLDVETENERLTRRNAELHVELQRAAGASGERDWRGAVPHAVELQIGRLSHTRDRQGDGMPTELIVYVQPLDGRGRFIQIVGELHATAVHSPAAGDPFVLGRVHLNADDLREAYRSGVAGTHYSIRLPLTLPDGADAAWSLHRSALVSVSFIEAETGRTLEAERTVPLSRNPRRN